MSPSEMNVEIVVLSSVPARHLTTGDHTAGFVISEIHRVPGIDGKTIHHIDFKLVWPYTTHSAMLTVAEKDLDHMFFNITKRGDAHSPSARNKALGLPEDLHRPVPPKPAEPVATYPAGTRIEDVKHFDRSQHILFKCPEHEKSAWSSKDPRSSSIFPQSQKSEDCTVTRLCKVSIYDYVTTHEYLPTRNG